MFWGVFFFFFFWSNFLTPEKQNLKNKSNPFYLDCQFLRRVRHLANCSYLSCWVSGSAPWRGGHISWDKEKLRSWCSSLLLPLTLCGVCIYVTWPLCILAAHGAQQSWPFSLPLQGGNPAAEHFEIFGWQARQKRQVWLLPVPATLEDSIKIGSKEMLTLYGLHWENWLVGMPSPVSIDIGFYKIKSREKISAHTIFFFCLWQTEEVFWVSWSLWDQVSHCFRRKGKR